MSVRLYTPNILALATDLAGYPLTDDLAVRGKAQSRNCGSSLIIGLALDAGAIAAVGVKASACAVGQAAAAIFASASKGKTRHAIAAALADIDCWLADPAAPLPDWPGLDQLQAARVYPARHGAITLAWVAALDGFDALEDQP